MSNDSKRSLPCLPALQAITELALTDLQPRRIDWPRFHEAEDMHTLLQPRDEGSWLPGIPT